MLLAFIHISRFASHDFFSENLKTNYAALLGDPVFAVRRSAVLILPLLAKQYSIDWTIQNIIPFVIGFGKNTNYLYRYIPLFGIQELIKSSLNQQSKYLDDFKPLVEQTNNDVNKKVIKTIAKVFKLTNKIKEKLGEQKCQFILPLNKNISDFEANDKINIYAEDVLDALKNSSNCNAFSVDEQSLLNNSYTYLEGMLFLIHKKFLGVVINLFNDTIINIQIRALYVLNEIKEFVERLNRELQESWIQEVLKELSSADLENINNKINAILAEEESQKFNNNHNTEEIRDVNAIINSEHTTNIVTTKDDLEIKLEYVKLEDEKGGV